jgi:acetate kinase
VQHLLYRQSGLLGVLGVSNDMRVLLDSPDPAAFEANDLFCYQVVSELAASVAALGWLDRIDAAANSDGKQRISAASSRVSAYVIPTNEKLVIARRAALIKHLIRRQELRNASLLLRIWCHSWIKLNWAARSIIRVQGIVGDVS